MKAISFRQPLAQALVNGSVKHAIRSWRTGIRGRMLIHAARIPLGELRNLCACDPVRKLLREWNISDVGDLPMGAFVGSAVLRDCIPLDEFSAGEEVYPFGQPERGWVWLFENAGRMAHPRMHPGKLGVFDTPFE